MHANFRFQTTSQHDICLQRWSITDITQFPLIPQYQSHSIHNLIDFTCNQPLIPTRDTGEPKPVASRERRLKFVSEANLRLGVYDINGICHSMWRMVSWQGKAGVKQEIITSSCSATERLDGTSSDARGPGTSATTVGVRAHPPSEHLYHEERVDCYRL